MGLNFTNRTVFLNDDEQRCYGGLPLVAPTIEERLPPQPVNVLDIWFEAPLDDGWVVAYRLALQGERVAVSEVRIFPAAEPRQPNSGRWAASVLGSRALVPAGGLKARTLRRVRLRAFERELSKILRECRVPLAFRAPEPSASGRKRGRKVNLRRYAEIAVFYAEQYEAASTHPTADVAKRFHLTPTTARAAVSAARRHGLLTATTRGERSGRPTGLALDLLKHVALPKGKKKTTAKHTVGSTRRKR